MNEQLELIEDEEAKQRKIEACKDLVRIADLMETCESPSLRGLLAKQYKAAMKAAGIVDKKGHVKGAKKIPANQLAASKALALNKVKEYLDDIERWEVELPKMVTSNDGYIAISHLGTTSGMACEVQFKICDSFYKAYSGYRCYRARVTLFSAKQETAWPSIHMGLVSFGLSLTSNRQDKAAFFQKYGVPYNEKVKREQQMAAEKLDKLMSQNNKKA